MKLSAPRWDNTSGDLDGLLYFGQRLDEMLFDFSIDLYKAPVLNTHFLLTEYISVYNNVEIDNKYLPVILEELSDTLSKDPIVNKYWGRDNVVKVQSAFRSLPDKAKITLAEYLLHAFGQTRYFTWCCEYVKWIVTQSNQKERIEQALKCLVPELIGKGYSSQYIFYYNKKCILKTDTPSIELFIDRFDCKKRKYKVYMAAEKRIVTFEDLLTHRMGIIFEDDGNYKKFKHDEDLVIFHFDDIEALDDQNASRLAFERVNLFLRFFTAVDNKIAPRFHNIAMVIEESMDIPAFVSFGADEYSVIEGMQIDEAGKYAEKLITDLITHARCSLPKLTKAIDLHNNSLKSSDYSGSFLNLWSALEVLSLKTVGNNDLEQVSGTILPILQLKYFASITNDFLKKLKAALTPETYNALLEKINTGNSDVEKIAALIFLEEYDELRDSCCKELSSYPVLRHRIHTLSDAAKEKKSLLNMSEKYRKRVDWHLSRIYRTRNALVHSGAVSRNIRYLGEHLHFYLDSLMLESFEKLSCGVQFCKLDNALLDSLLACEILKQQLNKKERLKADDLQILVDPTFTKQDKFEYICDCELD